MNFGIGQPVRRKEDRRLLTGQGRFSDDVDLPNQAYAQIVRSPHAHARITAVNTAAARAAPGVLAVLTEADYRADGLACHPVATPLGTDAPLMRRDGLAAAITEVWPLATDRVRRVGEAVALIVAETVEQAADAAELLAVDYEPLAAVADGRAALAPGATQLWDNAPGNLCVDDERGDRVATDRAFAGAVHVTRLDVMNNRVTGAPMEPRAAIGDYDPATGRHVLHAGSGNPLRHRDALCSILDAPADRVHVVCRDVGGNFGTRGLFYPEFTLVVWAAKRLGRPVKWTCGRGEAFLSDAAARDQFTHAELALDADGRFLAMRARHVANFGSHAISFVPLTRGISVTTGVYDIPAIHVEARAAFTNTAPIHTYRGAGRPEAMFLIERLIDSAAREHGFDPVALRRRNVIAPSAMPYANLTGMIFDSGAFEESMDAVLALADMDGARARRDEARRRGKLPGVGLANYIETATGIPLERAELEIEPDGGAIIVAGTQDSGQGHGTSYAQLIVDWLGVPFDAIRLIEGDTDIVKMGSGSHSSRSMRLAGYLLGQAKDDIVARGRRIAGHLLEAALADIEFADGRFTVAGTDRSLGLADVAAAAANGDPGLPDELHGKLAASAEIHELLPAFPNGCHVCEVEIDADTGAVEIVRYAGIDDVGRVINPLLVDGQTHGGIAQGVGQALLETCRYAGETGQLLSGSFLDYAMPRADDFPFFDLGFNEVPAANNPLGVKGAGEGGATGAPPAVVNAIVDALQPFGIRHIDMPVTSERVWRAIRDAEAAAAE